LAPRRAVQSTIGFNRFHTGMAFDGKQGI